MTKETMRKLKKGDTVYVACKVDAVFIGSGLIQVSTRDCDNGFDAYEDEVLETVDNNELDKIRAEIESYIDKEKLRFGGQFDSGLNLALKIIDKYKAENEDKE